MSLKYLFPIEERQHKSTAIIQRENVNIRTKIKEVQNHLTLSNSDKQIYLDLLEKTKFVLPSLTNPNLLE
jgi:taurine transport system permease protein